MRLFEKVVGLTALITRTLAHKSEANRATRRTDEQDESGQASERRVHRSRALALICAWDGYREKLLGMRHTEPVAAEFRHWQSLVVCSTQRIGNALAVGYGTVRHTTQWKEVY
jgi:hypothetical protein